MDAFDPSSSEEQWATAVQLPGNRSRSSVVLLVTDTDLITIL